MRNTFLFLAFILLLTGCKKNKYTTVPQLKYKSVNTTVLAPGNIIRFTLSFTDAEGDLSGDLYVEKFDPKCDKSGSRDIYALPSFPTSKDQAGEISVSYGYNVPGFPVPILPPQCSNRDDTCVFKFVLKDKAQNVSDTAVSETIVILR